MSTQHIYNLKKRVRDNFTSAVTYFETLVYYGDDDSYNVCIDEFQAGLDMIDDLVTKEDAFSSPGRGIAVRKALQTFLAHLDATSLRRFSVAALINDIDVATMKMEGVSC